MGQNSILQWNCRVLKANFNELLILLSFFNPKMCCLQETLLTPNDNSITENNLCLLNSNQHTYLHPGSGSFTAIDLSLCHPSLYLDYEWKVCEDSHGSDHFPIIMYESEETDSDKIPKWNFKKLTGKNSIFFTMKN